MPGTGIGVYPAEETAGNEVSSTYEGRHITVLESELMHPVHADDLVDKGDPVVVALSAATRPHATYGRAVGVALNSATAVTDLITVDTEGIWMLPFYADDDNGIQAIEAGDALWISDDSTGVDAAVAGNGTGDCAISKIRNNVTQVPFGYALGRANGGFVGQISIKVHWDPRSHWLLDNERLYFGDGVATPDVSLGWTGARLEMLPLGDNIDFNIGDGTNSFDVQIFGATANDYLLWDSAANTLDLENTVLAPLDRALSVNVAMALPEGEGFCGFFESTLAGQQAGLTYNLYSWMTLGGTFIATGTVTTPLDTGIYSGAGADLTAARLIFGAQHMAILDSVPLSYYPWRINVSAGAGSITALIQAGNIQSVGYIAAVTQNDPPIGYIPLAFIAGIAAAQPCYVRVYDDTD